MVGVEPPAGPLRVIHAMPTSKRVDLRVDDRTYKAIQRIADRDDRQVSDVIQDAINHYLEAS